MEADLHERKENVLPCSRKVSCELLKKPLVCLFTIDLEGLQVMLGCSTHTTLPGRKDLVDGPIKSELRSLCYKDGKLLIGTKCSLCMKLIANLHE